MAETGGNSPAIKNEEKLHGRESPKLACIINGGQNLIAPNARQAEQAIQDSPYKIVYPKNEYILHRQLNIYCNCP